MKDERTNAGTDVLPARTTQFQLARNGAIKYTEVVSLCDEMNEDITRTRLTVYAAAIFVRPIGYNWTSTEIFVSSKSVQLGLIICI